MVTAPPQMSAMVETGHSLVVEAPPRDVAAASLTCAAVAEHPGEVAAPVGGGQIAVVMGLRIVNGFVATTSIRLH